METFSEQLIDRMVAYALEKYGLRISREQAVEHLRSLGNLYITFAKIRVRNHKQENQTHEN